jgi:hypothetical protein
MVLTHQVFFYFWNSFAVRIKHNNDARLPSMVMQDVPWLLEHGRSIGGTSFGSGWLSVLQGLAKASCVIPAGGSTDCEEAPWTVWICRKPISELIFP